MRVAALFFVPALFLACAPAPTATAPATAPATPVDRGREARRLVQTGARLVDVRSPDEFAGGHIDGAINLPVDELQQHLDALGDRAGPVVVYCASGRRSARAAALLRELGFTAVFDLGPMSAWPQA